MDTDDGNTTKPSPDNGKQVDSAQKLLERHNNDALRTVTELLAENYGYREKLRELKAQLPPEGSVVLSKEDADTLEAYRAHGSPDDLKNTLSEYKGLQRQVSIRDLAGTTYNAKALTKLLPESAVIEQKGDAWLVDGKAADEYVTELEQTLGVTLRNKPVNVGGGSNPGSKAPLTPEDRQREALRTGDLSTYVSLLTAGQTGQ